MATGKEGYPMPMTENPTPRTGGRKWRVWGVTVLVPVIILAGGMGAYILLDPWQWHLNRSRYEEIVRRVEALGVPAGHVRTFLISKDKNPETLQRVDDLAERKDLYELLVNGQVVEARRHANNRLLVQIRMPGRRPNYGLIYSSGEPDADELRLSFGSDTMTRRRAAHWWTGEDRSD